jgi:hypothetical protein
MALVVALGATLAGSLLDDFAANAQGCANAIVCENQLAGAPASEWDVSGAGDPQIQGFATDISVAPGDTVRFKVDTENATAFSLVIYRLGYYNGQGARRIATVTPTIATNQGACSLQNATGLIDCGTWLESASWQVPIDAVSGIYFAKVTRLVDGNPTGGGSHIVFIVRDDAGNSDLLFQTSDTTWQAYNTYGGNSLYEGNSTVCPGRACKVSYNRPFSTREGTEAQDWLFNAEYPMVRWLEANGFDVSYASGVDTDRRGSSALQQHKVFLSVGHDEYWSGGQRANVEAARNAGVHLAFFSGNEIFWKTRWEASIDGANTPYRTLVCYKETHANAKIDPTAVWTGTWRDPRFSPPADGGRPENALTGTIFMVNDGATTAIQVPAAFGPLRFWRNTTVASLTPGQTATLSANTLGYEWDSDLDNGSRPAGLIRLSSRTVTGAPVLQDFGSSYSSGTATHNLTLYRHSNGALVFGAGTVQWSWGLDGTHDGGGSTADVRMRQATVNLLADMGVQPQTLQTGLTPATASTDSVPPSSTITSPASGSTVSPGSPVTITGTAGDAGGGIVAGVEVSVDGGLTWTRATGTTSWSVTWTPAGSGTATIRSRAFDDSGFIETPSSGVTVTIGGGGGGGGCPCSIWPPSTVPANPAESDAAAVELGVKFRSSVAGFITGIRYYKSSQNTGTHLGHLWTSTGTLLATATFAGESTSGWQQVNFSSPVAINPNTTYVASYHTTTGFYAQDSNYFTSSVTNGPLTALANGVDGGNGVYRYGASGFPNSTFQSSNYWIDVVFVTSVGSDTTPPTVSSVSPVNGASGVSASASVSVIFSEGMDPSTIDTSTIELRNPTNGLMPANVTWSAATFTATLSPTSALLNSTTYTLTVKGGATDPRVKDVAGNALGSNFTSTFTTAAPPPPPPDEGPGGPVLVVSSSANPFTRYYAEILRAEGLNAFLAMDIASVSSTVLANYDVVILGQMPLNAAQVTMFSDWVNAGGNLIAMRPDKQLASLLGLTDAGTTLPEAYLLVNTAAAPGAGIVNQTMQFHGTADRYTISGATAVATLYSNSTTATSNPAVTVRSVGTAGGQAAAFTYDLARSVVYTRQGNPVWSGQERDGEPPIRSDDLFFGGAQADWVDLTKVAIPQADEQQRLLANLILFMNADRKPLPRFWYLPRGLKAAVVMTGDDHANNGTAGRFDIYTADSPPGCSVTDWECVRATSYIYPNTPISPSQAAAFVANGFEIGVHVTTQCADFTPQSLEANFVNDLGDFAAIFPGLPAPKTNRTHCIAWSDYTTHAQTEFAHGIRFDTNYYYWPPNWVNDVPGLFTGSAMPMRFAKADGTLIDVYQATTQMTDESGQSYPLHINTLLDRALGSQGYYGVFTANMHTDSAVHNGSENIVASAQARGVPIVSSKQMLDWLDGRNGSTFGSLSWNGTTLSFSVGVGAGANGLRGLVPAASTGGPITSITRNGSPVSFTTQTIKGLGYAMFPATAGNYQVQYALDTTPPVISSLAAVAGQTSATVSWATDEPATSLVNYGLTPTSLTSSASVAGLRTGHEVLLTGLTAGTQYYYRVTSADAVGNSASAPASPATFTTNNPPPPGGITVSDTTAADFAGGTGTGTYVSESGNGELILVPAIGTEFSGPSLPTGWSSEVWNTGGAATVATGLLSVDGARANTDGLFGPGRALDFVATFGTAASQHVGFGVTFNETPWAIFSTGTGGSLFARTHTGATPTDTLIPGSWLNAPHDFRIEWNTSSVVFLIDGGVVATHAVTIDTNMRPIASDFTVGGNVLTVNWMRMSPYATSGTFDSRVIDGGAITSWGTADWTSIAPAGTSVALSARFGDTPVPDGTWTAFLPLSAPGSNNLSQTSRYLQYRAVLTSSAAGQTPSLNDITFTAAAGAIPPGISIADVSVNEGDTGQTNAVVTLTLSATTSSTVIVQYATADGTATVTTDYPGASGTATFLPNTTTTTITIPVNGDTTVEPNETFFVNLSSPVNGTITDGQGIVTIVNDDSTLSEFTIGNATVTEGNTGSILATLTVTLTPARTTGAATVTYQTVDGTATAGSDYSATSGTLTFAAGVTTQTLTVPVLGDTLDEANETFLVRLSAPVGAALGTPSQGTGTITDNDATPSFRINDVSVTEGNAGTALATFTVTLSTASGRATSVNYATSNGTATVASGDYVAASGTLSFPAGTTSQTVAVTINGDLLNEANETVNLNLSGATNATIADNRGIATIVNDDPLPTLSIADTSVTEANSGTRNVTFTVTLSAASGRSVTVNYATANGTALSGSDYMSKTGTVTFSAGQTTRTFTVSIVNDRIGEETETFLVNLTGATNATIADGQAVCTITDNDAPIEAP